MSSYVESAVIASPFEPATAVLKTANAPEPRESIPTIRVAAPEPNEP